MTTPAKTKPTRAAICRKWKITNPTLLQWEAEGVNIYCDEQMTERNARKHGGSASAEMAIARLQKLQAEARSATLKADEMAGKLIDIAEVEACFVRIGTVTKSLLQRLRADLPPALEGQSASRMSEIIGQSINAILTQMSDPEGMTWRKE
jgi:hypothetical protein